jgi:hypothetical protein
MEDQHIMVCGGHDRLPKPPLAACSSATLSPRRTNHEPITSQFGRQRDAPLDWYEACRAPGVHHVCRRIEQVTCHLNGTPLS